MASIQRADTTNLSSPDAGLHNVGGGASHRNFGAAGLEKSHSFRESHEGRVSSSGGGGPSTSHGEALPLTSVLFLDSISLPNGKSTAQVELRRAMNAASGQVIEDPSLGNIQSKALENCSAEEIKRVRGGLVEGANRARERVRHLAEAVIKVDRYNAMQSRKRNRADGGAHDRASHGGAGPRGAGGLGHVTKGSGRGASSSGEGSGTGTGAQKGGDKSKGGMINKRMRTSLADARPEGRPSNLSVQRSSGVQERERESPRPSGTVNGSVEEKEKGSVGGGVGGGEGWEKTKLKGRRSATVKAEASSGVSAMNGTADGEREPKGSSQQHRAGGGDGRAPRPSEGHGFRSGPVHGSLSVQKAESVVLANGSGIRGGSKLEGDAGAHSSGKADRGVLSERERSNGKGVAKPVGREEARAPSPGMVPKAKGARAPRSNLVGGGSQGGVLARSSSFADVREKSLVTSPVKGQVPAGPMNRKRAAPSRSSSPPVASWGSSRPQKKARARRVNVLPPVSISGPAREEANGVEEAAGPASREGSASGAIPSSRGGLAVTVAGGNVAKRASGGQSGPQTKAQTERVSGCAAPAVSEVSLEEGQKRKGRRPKAEDEEGEQQRGCGTVEKSGSVAVAMSRGVPVPGGGDESGGGDGVRRQGRTGRGPVTTRVAAVSSPMEKVEVSPVNAKPTRIGRASVETKSAGVGRPAKNGNSDRKPSSRPRRLLNSNGTEFSGEEDDDHEQLSRAVQQAVECSASACPNSFWRQVEPYFAYVTAEDLSFLRRHMAMADEMNPTSQSQSEGVAVKSPFTGDRVSDSDEVKNWNSVREQGTKERNLRRGRGGGWYDKVFPLSQLVTSAIISEREDDDREKVFGDSCADRDSDSRGHLSNHSEMDYYRRDGEGESDVDNLRAECEWWSAGAREGVYGRGCPMRGGPGSRLSVEEQDGDDILVRSNGHGSGGGDWGNGVESHVGDGEAGLGGQSGNGSMEWEEQYRRMSLDDRLRLELSSIGLLPGQSVEEQEEELDDVGEELRRLETELAEQAWRNKEHLSKLEGAVLEMKAVEERAREKLAMDKLVEMAHKKKSGGRSAKGAAAKGAKLAALAVAKRALGRVHEYEAGRSCLTDPALRDRLFCVPPSLVESTPDAAMDGGAGATTAERMTSPTGGAVLGGVCGGEGAEEGERPSLNGPCSGVDFSRLKEEAWPSRMRDREAFLEDVFVHTSTRDVNSLSSNGLGGMKGKRSERERDGKVKEARTGPNSAKGERKTKTKPRQKTGPVMKPVQGLGAKAADPQCGKGRSSNQGHEGHGSATAARHGTRREEAMASLPVFRDVQAEPDGPLDLTGIPMPGMEEMSMDQADIGSWLDFALEDPVQSTDDGLMGLDIPMDDLSGLMMM